MTTRNHKAGKRFARAGLCRATGSEKISSGRLWSRWFPGRLPYRKLPEMLHRLEAGKTGLLALMNRQTDETFETEFTAAKTLTALHPIIEGWISSVLYCVVPYTRGKRAAANLKLGS